MRLRLAILIFSLIAFNAKTAHSAQYDYHPQSVLRLGGGFDPSRPLDTFRRCLKFIENRIERGTVSASFQATVVKSRAQFLSIVNISASLSGHYGLFGGGGSFSYDSEYSFDNDSLTWAVVATNDYGRAEVTEEKFEPFAESMIAGKKWKQFADACGKEVATQERRIAKVAAVFSVTNLSQSEKENLTAAASFQGGSTGVWDAGAQASYHKFVSQASQVSTIKVSVFVIGGDGISVLADLATDYSDIQAVTNAVRTYIAGLTFEKAAPLSYSTARWNAYGWEGSQLDLTRQYEIMASLYTLYQDAQKVRERLQRTQELASRPEYAERVSQTQRDKISKNQDVYTHIVEDILTRAENCREKRICNSTTSIKMPVVEWPNLQPISRVQVLGVYEQGCSAPPGTVTQGCYTLVELDITYDTAIVDSIRAYRTRPTANEKIFGFSLQPQAQITSSTAYLSGQTKRPKNAGLRASSTWISEKKDFLIIGANLSGLTLLVRDKQGIDEPYFVSTK
ncbi:hypothetical protein SAMN02799636_04280 [Methylobacterium sp. 275MFSha3.1]|uniref:hypothetical protein n=1 Tax=Methylobacterium sp. 275MFSha3.1 TaxID=1502746 RepID=UPI0008A7952D|nr:hypothetical protein [Methylobacterium sp. 275MFSha3.1]SEH88556.1 hypothetical protein SAMN02799636_04280 [Methylobacterium sp. 275MFSha3.1]